MSGMKHSLGERWTPPVWVGSMDVAMVVLMAAEVVGEGPLYVAAVAVAVVVLVVVALTLVLPCSGSAFSFLCSRRCRWRVQRKKSSMVAVGHAGSLEAVGARRWLAACHPSLNPWD